jgi:hypothetical protein
VELVLAISIEGTKNTGEYLIRQSILRLSPDPKTSLTKAVERQRS